MHTVSSLHWSNHWWFENLNVLLESVQGKELQVIRNDAAAAADLSSFLCQLPTDNSQPGEIDAGSLGHTVHSSRWCWDPLLLGTEHHIRHTHTFTFTLADTRKTGPDRLLAYSSSMLRQRNGVRLRARSKRWLNSSDWDAVRERCSGQRILVFSLLW